MFSSFRRWKVRIFIRPLFTVFQRKCRSEFHVLTAAMLCFNPSLLTGRVRCRCGSAAGMFVLFPLRLVVARAKKLRKT